MSVEKNAAFDEDFPDDESDDPLVSDSHPVVLPIKKKLLTTGIPGLRNSKPKPSRIRASKQIRTSDVRQKASPTNPELFEQELAALFDPVGVEALKEMFPDESSHGWNEFADRAKQMGLDIARQGRRKFNPYLAGKWWLSKRNPPGWTEDKLLRTLAKNVPARSRDKRYLLSDRYEE